MKLNLKKLLLLLLVIPFLGCSSNKEQKFETVTIENPIMIGFYPDPSVCQGPDGYYMVHSTFSYYPGIPIFYSPDLVHWEQIGHVMTRPEQLTLDGLKIASDGIYAPTIEYNNGKFYVACTVVRERGNYIVTAEDPRGEWSDPYWLPNVNGIDPSLFFDDNGKTYLVFNSDAPNHEPLYDGHRTIKMVEMDMENMKTKGEEKIVINGGVDISQEPVWIEGPHLYKIDGMYYICCAEGGTSVNHRQVIFRSENATGPFIPWDKNPILTQMHLDDNRPNPITSTGHADLIQDLKGNWWAVFLACRPYEDNYYNLGRETYMAPIKWEDGWPIINPDFDEVQMSYTFDAAIAPKGEYERLNGALKVREEFVNQELDQRWMMIRTPYEKWYSINSDNGGSISMQLRSKSLLKEGNPSFIGRRQQHLLSSASTEMNFEPYSMDEKAGLIVLQNETHFYFLCKSLVDEKPVVELYQSTFNDKMLLLAQEVLNDKDGSLMLKIESEKDNYNFYYSENDEDWSQIGESADARFLSTETAGGFVGCTYGLYAVNCDEEIDTNSEATFFWFEYEGDDSELVR